ncbi:MAG TPA: hypothetical protein VHW93_08475, partial [Acidimicrobiales bacterium]|nr:hypothetical protein [Acidimicrobiales bacterium]
AVVVVVVDATGASGFAASETVERDTEGAAGVAADSAEWGRPNASTPTADAMDPMTAATSQPRR